MCPALLLWRQRGLWAWGGSAPEPCPAENWGTGLKKGMEVSQYLFYYFWETVSLF